MIVYIVTSGEYSDYHIAAVFDNKEKAELYCAVHERELYSPDIEEWDTDEVKLESCVPVKKLWYVILRSDGSVSYIGSNLTIENRKCVERFTDRLSRRTRYRVFVTLDKDSTKEQALKVMFDYLAKWKAEHCEI